MIDSRLFYETLFDPEDRTCFGMMTTPEGKIPGIYNTKLQWASATHYQKRNYFTINPMHTSRKKTNVMKFRNFMVEMDYHTLDEQKRLVKASGLPWSTAVFSGGDSIHFIVSLVTPLASIEEYNKLAHRLYAAMEIKKMKEDQGNKNATRFSRTPNVFREDKGQIQHLLKVNGRIDNEVFFDWVSKRLAYLGIDEASFEPKVYLAPTKPEGAEEMCDDDKYKWVKEYWVKGHVMERNRHMYLYMVASGCNKVGISPNNAKYYMTELTGWSGGDGGRDVSQAEVDKQVDDTYDANRSEHAAIFLNKPMTKAEFKAKKLKEKTELYNTKYKLNDYDYGI